MQGLPTPAADLYNSHNPTFEIGGQHALQLDA